MPRSARSLLLLACVVFGVAGSGCKPLEGGLEVEVKFSGFTPACLDVTVTDRLDSSNNGSEQVTVTASKPHVVAVAMGKGWSRSWSVTVAGHEGSCAGKIVATVSDDMVEIPKGRPIKRSYTLSATDSDRDGYVAMSSNGTDCNDGDPMSSPGLTEMCGDGIDNDCTGGADCADPKCSSEQCDDGNFCTVNETCGATGCSGVARDCGAPPSACRQADAGRCEPGGCFWPLSPPGTTCAAGMACNSSGVCVLANTELNCFDGRDDDNDDAGIDCGDSDCNTFGCDAGLCVTGATCQAGACAGAPVMCPPPQLCRDAGVCNAGTGACDFPPSPAGASCTRDLCITGQSCDGVGACAGGAPVPCVGGACQSAYCDAGACTVVSQSSGTCDDGAGCTHSDVCTNGTCAGTTYACQGPIECQTGGACQGDGGCGYASAPNGASCDGGFCLTGTCRVFPYAASNVNPATMLPSGGLLLNCAATFDSNDGGGTWCGATPAVYLVTQDGGGEPATVISVRAFDITSDGGSLRLTGSRPVIIVSWDPGVTLIDGLIDARSASAAPAAGGNRASCGLQAGGVGGNNAAQRGSGGGGGGFATRGGFGSPSDTGTTPGGDGGTLGPLVLRPLVGGCPGGQGGSTTSGAGGLGGAGGGALQISVAGTLRLGPNGVLTVSGGGAPGTPDNSRAGGGGGGSGGAILLEALALDLLSGAWLTANGGGGGEGADADEPGDPGDDGAAASSTAAAGGDGLSGSGSAGGAGAAGAAAPVSATLGALATGGGGGGAAGLIHLRVNGGACTRAASFSPAYTNAGGCP